MKVELNPIESAMVNALAARRGLKARDVVAELIRDEAAVQFVADSVIAEQKPPVKRRRRRRKAAANGRKTRKAAAEAA